MQIILSFCPTGKNNPKWIEKDRENLYIFCEIRPQQNSYKLIWLKTLSLLLISQCVCLCVCVCACPLSTTIIYVIITIIRFLSAFWLFWKCIITCIAHSYSCIKYSNQVSYVHCSQITKQHSDLSFQFWCESVRYVRPVAWLCLNIFSHHFIWMLDSIVSIRNMSKLNYKMNAFWCYHHVRVHMFSTPAFSLILFHFRLLRHFNNFGILGESDIVYRYPIPDAE